MPRTEFEVELLSFLRVKLSLCSWIVAVEAAWLAWHISGEGEGGTPCYYLMHDQSSRLQQWPQHRAVGHIMLLIEHSPSLRGYAGCILVLLAERSRGCSNRKFQNTSGARRLFSRRAKICVCVCGLVHMYWQYIWTCARTHEVYCLFLLRVLTSPAQPLTITVMHKLVRSKSINQWFVLLLFSSRALFCGQE